jgi:hypothetical protein
MDVPGGFLLLALAPTLLGQLIVPTWHNDAARTGQNLSETVLTPANVNVATFGKLFTISVDGLVDAQPLYVESVAIPAKGLHNVLYVATEHGSVYAFDADTGAQLWRVSLLLGGETTSDIRSCDQVVPEIGITSTPAIDVHMGPHGIIYAVAMSKGSGRYHHRLHALDLTTGAEQFGGPMEVRATYPGHGAGSAGGIVTFDPAQYKERAALLISNGVVYTSWTSHCDIPPYTAWVIGYNESTLAQVSVLDMTPNGNDGSIWQSGAGPAVDAGGNLFLLLANGTFGTTLNPSGFPTGGDYGNAFMNLSTTPLAVADYFTMLNTVAESNSDEDLGSGGPLLMPTVNDAQGRPRALAVGAGKDGNIYVVDRNNMGKFKTNKNAIYQELPAAVGSVFSSPAWFNGTLYYGGVSDWLKAFPFANGAFLGSPSSHTPISFVYPGTTPSISANGSANGIVWAAENKSAAVLHAYDAANLRNALYNSNQAPNGRDHFGTGNKFITPTVANGKVYVGTTNGVGAFGLLGCTYTLSASSANFGSGAGSGSVNVITSDSCSWSVANSSNFITVTGGTSGSGNGTVHFSFPANPGLNRTGALNIAAHTFTVSQAGDTTTAGFGFYPLPPCRLADTRASGGSALSGPFGPPFMTGGSMRSFPVPASFCNVPSTAQAYSVNITVVPHGPLGYLTAWPTGAAQPFVAMVNSPNGTIVGNATIIPATYGSISVFVTNDTDVVMDINGYFAPPDAPQALAFYLMPPCRVVDTRTTSGKTGAFGPPQMTGGSARDFPMPQSTCGIPATAQAYSLNVTAVAPGPLQYLTAWPTGQPQPFVATVNGPQGGTVGNSAIVPAGTNGSISAFVSNTTDVMIDINGYFAPPGGAGALYFYPATPCRVADTRTVGGSGETGLFGPPQLAANQTRDFPVPSSGCGIPATAQSYSLNITVVAPGPLQSLTAWAAGQAQPPVATLYAPLGGILGHASLVPGGTSGAISVFVTDNTDVVVDINGYLAP